MLAKVLAGQMLDSQPKEWEYYIAGVHCGSSTHIPSTTAQQRHLHLTHQL
jgi:hypothetical protein